MNKSKFFKAVAMFALAVTLFMSAKVDSYAMSDVAQQHVRQLTQEEIEVISRVFNPTYYANRYPDVAAAFGNDETALFTHFIVFGIWEQRQPTAEFNVDAYATRNPDLQYAIGDDIVAYYIHYASYPAERSVRALPTLEDSYYHDTDVYSVYDFVKGQYGPKAGAVPVQTRNYHPALNFKSNDPVSEVDYYKNLDKAEAYRQFNGYYDN